ncbi:MAG: N-acetylmuramoyl-L-alanine amidase [Clostridiales bacterium]|nr:N-acetylmuramoyl-L-alanine amidase [Clostridiales bacterium]
MKMVKPRQTAFLFLLLFLLALSYLLYYLQGSVQTANYCRFPAQTLVIDAGHGGEDGGAVALSGTAESSINLAIALKMDQLCGLYGVQTRLVRTEDVSLADVDAATLREKKHSDLLNRVALIEETENAVLLSIHQNNYTSASSHGAQVFYRADGSSQQWAVQLQELLRKSLDPENTRQATEIPDTVYLMNHVSCRAVLVECGFLSNPAENALLKTDGYQTRIAAALTASYLRYNESLGD